MRPSLAPSREGAYRGAMALPPHPRRSEAEALLRAGIPRAEVASGTLGRDPVRWVLRRADWRRLLASQRLPAALGVA